MLFTKLNAAEKRKNFREGLASGKLLQFPGAFNPLCAQLIESKGSIIYTVSGLGLQGHVRQTAYGATKAALIQLTRAVATTYGAKGVRCNAVAPGLVLTETTAKEFPAHWRKNVEDETLRGISGAPEDIAEPVAFLASDAARNITGQTLASDGGVSIHVPGYSAYSKAVWDEVPS